MTTLRKNYFILTLLTVFFIVAGFLFLTKQGNCRLLGNRKEILVLEGKKIEILKSDPEGCKYAVNLGSFPANQGIIVSLSLKNYSEKVVNVIDIKTFCGCSITNLSNKKLGQNEVSELNFAIIPNSLEGKFSKVMYIKTDAKRYNLLKIRYFGDSQPFFRVKPTGTFYANIIKKDVVLLKKFTVIFKDKLKDIFIKTPDGQKRLAKVIKGNLRPFIHGNLKSSSIVSVDNITKKSFDVIMSVEPKNVKKGKASLAFVLPIVKPQQIPSLRVKMVGRIY